jgi:hypothetical protein
VVHGIVMEGPDVLLRGVAGDFASGTDDVAFPGLAMAFRNCGPDQVSIPVTHHPHRINVSQYHLVRPHFFTPLLQGREKVQIDNVAFQPAHVAENGTRIPTDVKPHQGTHLVNAVDQSFSRKAI